MVQRVIKAPINNDVLIDVTRLFGREISYITATGVDRVFTGIH